MKLGFLNKIFTLLQNNGDSTHSLPEDARQASVYWNQWQQLNASKNLEWVDWGDHPVILKLIYQSQFGSPEKTVFHYLLENYPAFAKSKALSLCSGDGAFERLLIEHGIFDHITGIDVADERVKTANLQHCDFAEKLNFTVGDVNTGNFGHQLYDVVFAKAALHHVNNLELLFEGIKHCLKPGGYLVTIDFFGPTRFQWPDKQLQYARQMLARIPPELRTKPDGTLIDSINRPTIDQMIAMDPSEAVRSEDIIDFIKNNFETTKIFDIGGTLLNLVFTQEIINNFRPDNPQHVEILRDAYFWEQELIASNEISSDFKFIVAN